MSGIRRVARLGGVLVGALGWSAVALAVNWEVAPRIEVGGQYDDNYRLQLPGAEDSVSGGALHAQFEFRTVDPVHDFRFLPGVHATYFPGDTDDDSTNPFVELGWDRKGQRSRVGFSSGWARESVTETDRLGTGDGDLGAPVGGDSGYITLQNRREMARFEPSASFEVSERSTVELYGQYWDVDYEEEVAGYYVSYSNVLASLGYSYKLDPRSSLSLRGTWNKYDPTGFGNTAEGYGATAEWTRQITEKSEAYLRAGFQHMDFDRPAGGSTSDTNYLAGAGINWTGQLTQVFLDATRTIEPNPTGFTVERDQVRLRVTRNLRPLLSAFVGLRALKDSAADGDEVLFRGRRYGVASLGLQWRASRNWAVLAQYNYTRQKYDGEPTSAKSNSAFLSVVYEPKADLNQAPRSFLAP